MAFQWIMCVRKYSSREYFSVVVYMQRKWGQVRSLGGLFSSERRILDQLADRGGEEESKGTHFFPSSKLEVSLSPFLCASNG